MSLVLCHQNQGQNIIISARNIGRHLRNVWGAPLPQHTNAWFLDVRASLRPGEVAIFVSDAHTGIVTRDYADQNTSQGDFWVLPAECK